MLYPRVIFGLNCVMRWVIKVHDIFMLCLYHVGELVYGLWLWPLWWPRYVIVMRSSKCPPIGSIQWYLVILDRLWCFVTGLSSNDGFYDDLGIFKVNLVEVWQIYIQYHDLGVYLRVRWSDNNYLAKIRWELCLFEGFMIIWQFHIWFGWFVTHQKIVEK